MIKKIEASPRLFAIFYGAVGSIIAALIWHFSPSIGNWLAKSSFRYLVRFIDTRYANAATLEPINYSFYLLTVLFGVVVFVWFEIIGKAKKRIFGKENKDEKQNKKLSSFEKWFVYIIITFVIPFYMLYGLLQIGGQVITLNAITNFKHHIRIIRPYISKKENDIIVSKWSQMDSAKDYQEIYKTLAEIAKKENLTLPNNKQY